MRVGSALRARVVRTTPGKRFAGGGSERGEGESDHRQMAGGPRVWLRWAGAEAIRIMG